ncbi:MAG: outer membrane lipoprotein carrier protein LolA [Candidatus Coprovivens sp.]
MRKFILLLISVLLLTGCGKVNEEELVKNFKNQVESSKSYIAQSSMEIYNGDDTFEYDIKVYYMDDDYFKVDMINTLSNHEQVILRNSGDVYVVTPSLNKSYKFESEWPYNSSQSYILNSLVKDMENNKIMEFKEEEDGYSLKVGVDYPNNNDLEYEVLYFDKKLNLKMVAVYDVEDIMSIKVVFNKIDYKANLSKKDFDVESLIDENCCSIDDDKTEETSILDEIVYPLYVPANTFLKNRETINTENGERVILTFNGDKNFVLIEEVANVSEEFEIIPVYGDPLMLSNTIGALSTNSLSWSHNNIDYYLASNDLSTSEILSIADSLSVANVVEEK